MFLFSEMVGGGLTVRRRGKGDAGSFKLSLCLASWRGTTRVSVSAHVHFSDHIHVVSLKTGTDGGEKKGKLSLCLVLPLGKIMGRRRGMKVSYRHSLTSATDAVVCDHFHALPVSRMRSRTSRNK